MPADTPHRVRAILIKDGQLLTVHRTKPHDEYWVLPGGKVEPGETPAQALIREVLEETCITCAIGPFFTHDTYQSESGPQEADFYIANFVSGAVCVGQGPEYTKPELYTGTFTPEWQPLATVAQLDLRPHSVRDLIIKRHSG